MRDLGRMVDVIKGRCVLIVGDVMLDEYIWGGVTRISPEAPVPVVAFDHSTTLPGGAANVAANVASLGGRPLLGGAVGDDPRAAQLSAALREHGVGDEGLVVEATRPTTSKTRIVAQEQQIVRLDSEVRDDLPLEVEDELLKWTEAHIAEAGACVLSDYGKGVVSSRLARRVIELARERDQPVIVDPKGRRYEKYRNATLFTPNLHEAYELIGIEVASDGAMGSLGNELLDLLGDSALLVTRGAGGMSLFERGASPVHIAAAARSVYDVTGAGDTVVGSLALALAAGATLEQSARFANLAAGVAVSKFGTALVTPEELTG